MKNIDSDLIRGNIDTIILTTMLDGDKYGLDIIKDVEIKSNGTYELKQPTLYSCLKRLENQELISSYWLDSDIGGRRHYYKLTEKGRDSLLKKQEEWAKSKFIIDNLLSNHDYDEYRLVKKEDYDKIIEGKQFEYTPSHEKPELGDIQDDAEDSLEEAIEDTIQNDEQDEIDDILEYESLVDEDESAEDYNSEESSVIENNDSHYDSSVSDKRIDYSDDSDEIENDFPNQKRFKIPSIYDSINISEDDIDEAESGDDEIVDSIYNESETFFEEDETENDDDFIDLDEQNEEFILGNEADDISDENEDDRVYVSNYNTYDEVDDDDLDIQVEQIADQSKNELNILSKLRMQDDDEVNEYIGDKNSYVNHLNKTSEIENLKRDDLNVVQEDLLSSGNYLSQSSIDDKINEFSSAIDALNRFGSEPTEYDNLSDFEEDSYSLDIENENTDFSDSGFDSETEIEDEIISNNNLQQDSEEIIDFKKEPEHKDDYLDELEELKTLNNQGFFNSDDSADYDSLENNIEQVQSIANFDSLNDFLQTEELDAEFEKQVQEYNSQFGYDEPSYKTNQEESFDYQENEFASSAVEPMNFSTFDDIISKNVDSYTSDTNKFMANEEYHTFTPSYTENNYKQKLNNLSAYSKTNEDHSPAQATNETNEDVMSKVKDIQSLKAEFADEGICIKEFKRSNGHADVDRNYLLINKMNLVKSLILFFGYIFVLSAVYIIMNNTSAQTIHNFSFKYFLIGFIPFGIYALYHAIMFIVNPYKKIPAKFAPRIMIFIAIIITIQLLLITYCVNLQLGFYSFSQNLYNHLLWVIPTIISFAPIIATLIHIALYYSKNFNV